jgi:hypothetical protein
VNGTPIAYQVFGYLIADDFQVVHVSSGFDKVDVFITPDDRQELRRIFEEVTRRRLIALKDGAGHGLQPRGVPLDGTELDGMKGFPK